MDYSKNIRYFTGISFKGPIWLIIISVVLAIAGFATGGPGIVVGILGIGGVVGSVFMIISKKKKASTDAAYDAAVMSQLDGLKEKALRKLGIDEDEVKEIAPITFGGYKYSGIDYIKLGADNRWRTNKYESAILFFSEHEVHCYSYNFDTTKAQFTESTEVYFYQDIVSASTASESVNALNNNINYEVFKLTTKGGTSLTVSLFDTDGSAQRSINAMRSLLKAKKQG